LQSIIDDHTRLADLIEAGDADAFTASDDAHMRRVHGLPIATEDGAR
jgi:hypothetical protein